MVIAPRRALGITYEGLSGLDQSGDKPLAWFSGGATIRVKKMKVPAASIQVRIAGGAASPSPIEIFANDASVFRGELSDASIETTFDLPKTLDRGGRELVRFVSAGAPYELRHRGNQIASSGNGKKQCWGKPIFQRQAMVPGRRFYLQRSVVQGR